MGDGTINATATDPPVPPYDDTTAFNVPGLGAAVSCSVNAVDVAAEIEALPLLSATVDPSGLNPVPATTSVDALWARVGVLAVTVTAMTLATCTGAPLVPEYDATVAVSGPGLGALVN